GKKHQKSGGFLFPVPSSLYQLLEEQDSFRSKFRETLFQQCVLLLRIASGEMIGMDASLPRSSTREEFMTGDLRYVGAVNDQFLLGDARRQQFAKALPGCRVEGLTRGSMACRGQGPVCGCRRGGGRRRPWRQGRLRWGG